MKQKAYIWGWWIVMTGLALFPLQAGAVTIAQRLMTYNVRHCAGLDDVLDLERTAKVIKDCAADVVAVQELDSVCTRSGKVYQLGELARLTGMNATFSGAINYQGGKYGVGILSKERPLSYKQIPLPGNEKRTLLVCEFEHYVYACTHLALEEENRLASIPIILEEASRWDGKPFIMAGDWNDQPTTKFMLQLQQDFLLLNDGSACTFPANNPTRCIDYIAVYQDDIKVTDRKVVEESAASDHRPLYVDVEIEEDEGDLLRYTFDDVNMTANVRAYSENTLANAARYKGSIVVPEEVTTDGHNYCVVGVGESAFYNCDKLKAICLSDGITSVGKSAFQGCSQLETVVLSEKMESIGAYAFAQCSGVKFLEIPDAVTEIMGYAFDGCDSLVCLKLSARLETIGPFAFQNCSRLQRVVLPAMVRKVSQRAFYDCPGMKTLVLSDGVSGIAKNAFAGCMLDSIIVEALTPPEISSGAFDKTNGCPIYVPREMVATYKVAENWAAYADRIVGYNPTAIYGVQIPESDGKNISFDLWGHPVLPQRMQKGRIYIQGGQKVYQR